MIDGMQSAGSHGRGRDAPVHLGHPDRRRSPFTLTMHELSMHWIHFRSAPKDGQHRSAHRACSEATSSDGDP